MKKYKYFLDERGKRKKSDWDLKKKLNLNYLKYTNLTHAVGKHDLPEIICTTNIYPDYLALYCHPSDYHKTSRTAVCFYLYDDEFAGKNGLYNAIYYDDLERQEWFKKRFAGVKFFISPDYSLLGDIDDLENNYRLKMSRVVAIWLTKELGAVVILHISFPTLKSLEFAIDGLEKCTTVAFSTKGYIDDVIEREILKESVKYTVDKLSLKAIIVYDACATME